MSPPPPRATSVLPRGTWSGTPFDVVLLESDERYLRRRVLVCVHGDRVLLDLPEARHLNNGDVLVLDDGRLLGVIATDEPLYEVGGRDAEHLARLAWHIGNRHLSAQIEEKRILIRRDHVIRHMLEGLGASVTEVSEPFDPERGAYASRHAHDRGHDHA